jgi:hypothetical protein
MTDHLCGCGRPAPDSTLCTACGYDITAALAEITAYHGLGWDLDIALAKQTRFVAKTAAVRSVTGKLPRLPYAKGVSLAAGELKNVLSTWARVIVEETRAEPPRDTITSIASWLRPRAEWLRHHPAGQEAHDGICDAVNAARRVCDRPAERIYAGPCDGEDCEGHLYARPGMPSVRCAGCGLVYDVETRRTWLLAALDDHLANSQQMARLVGYLGITLPDSNIRYWASKGRIRAHSTDPDGRPLYRLGDVVRAHARPSSKAS